MEYTVAVMKRISGDTDNDKLIASKFCKEVLTEAQIRADEIEHICDLGMILNTESFGLVKNALAGIRHLTLATKSVAEFHHDGELGTTFSGLCVRLDTIREKAEVSYRSICMLFPSSVAN